MESVTFLSALPYLTLSLRDELPKAIQFVTHKYTTSDPQEIRALMSYGDTHKAIISAEFKGVSLSELLSLYEAAEEAQILQAEARELERAEREKRKKEEHEFYSTLRGADHAYR